MKDNHDDFGCMTSVLYHFKNSKNLKNSKNSKNIGKSYDLWSNHGSGFHKNDHNLN